MEALEVHNKDFLIKWIHVPENAKVNWQVKPLKKSILFRIYYVPSGQGVIATDNSSSLEEKLENSGFELLEDLGKLAANNLYSQHFTAKKGGIYAFVFDNTFSKKNGKKLLFNQFIDSSGNCNGSESLSSSTDLQNSNLTVPDSKNMSSPADSSTGPSSISAVKQVVSPRIPSLASNARQRSSSVYSLTNMVTENESDFKILKDLSDLHLASLKDVPPPPSPIGNSSGNSSSSNSFRKRPSLGTNLKSNRHRSNSKSSQHLSDAILSNGHDHKHSHTGALTPPAITTEFNSELTKRTVVISKNGRFIEGYLLKKKRKKHSKSYPRRFFKMNFKYGVLDYFLNDQSSALRGSMPVKRVFVTANKKTLEITIDSGLEIWHLKALNPTDWEIWVSALNIIREKWTDPSVAAQDSGSSSSDLVPETYLVESELAAAKLSTLKIIQDIKESYGLVAQSNDFSPAQSTSVQPPFQSMLKHKNSSDSGFSTTSDSSERRRKSIFSKSKTLNQNDLILERKLASALQDLEYLHEQLGRIGETVITMKKEQSNVKSTGSSLTSTSRAPANLHKTSSQLSMSSVFSEQQFFDAHEYVGMIQNSDTFILVDNEDNLDDDVKEDDGAVLRMMNEKKYSKNVVGLLNKRYTHSEDSLAFTEKAATLEPVQTVKNETYYPLSELRGSKVKRRDTLPHNSIPAPSLIQFLKKNVGKDLGSTAMPVTYNEPLTMLQRSAEVFEYANLIDTAIQETDPIKRLLYISTFAISFLSSSRCKERNVRKPFMPLLGETFELVREDLGFRMILEKVSHKPVVFCLNVDNEKWEVSATVMPVNKFWGKSMEIITKGEFRLELKDLNEVYEWTQPTTMLRNLIAGEKYVEPVESIAVSCSNGNSSTVEFKAGGMFSGRSEELTIKAHDAGGQVSSEIVRGTWTESLFLSDLSSLTRKKPSSNDVEIWHAHELLHDSGKKYGFTKFAAELNEITVVENGKLPPTDSRLRPDLKVYEQGDTETAETLKLQLEQKQRDRRNKGEKFVPLYFKKSDSDMTNDGILLNWRKVVGEQSYWAKRERNDWQGSLPLFTEV